MKKEIKLLPCPFCGGEVKEEKVAFNLAHARCTECDEEWGHCGSLYDQRYEKWNKRYNKAT